MLSYNLDFNSCAIRDGFRKSSHILCVVKLCSDCFKTWDKLVALMG